METLAVLVPGDRAGKVIGKAGAGLKQIRESGCKMQLFQEADVNGFRRAEFTGSADAIGAGFHNLISRAFLAEMELPTAVQVMIAPDKAGNVIGKGGENLRKVREMTSVNIQVEREPVTNPATGVPERAMTLKGEARYLGAALRVALSFCGAPGPGGGHIAMAPQVAVGAIGAAPVTLAGSSMTLTQVSPVSADPDEMQLHLAIPGKYAGAVLGKEGANVKRIKDECGCRSLTMTKRETSGSERRVIVLGNYMACVAAQQAVHALHVEAAAQDSIAVEEVTVIYFLPKNAAGAVIGKAGANLKAIREQSGVKKCDVAREEVEGQRPCTIIGPLSAVQLAQRLIQQQALSAAGPGDDGKRAADTPGDEPLAKRPRTDGAAAAPAAGGAIEVAVKILIPSRSAGAVIGKGGSMLKELRETHAVQIEMLQAAQAPQWPQDRVVILRGRSEAKQAACSALLKIAFASEEANCMLKMLVPAASAGAVIGKAGGTLKTIREQCGTQLKVEREEILGDRLVTAAGPLTNVSASACYVIAVLDGTQPSGIAMASGGGDAGFAAQGQPVAAVDPAAAAAAWGYGANMYSAYGGAV